ncbi:hypothetical protein Tco_1339618 [Tanacetum coccineum]
MKLTLMRHKRKMCIMRKEHFFMTNHIQEMIFKNEEKYTPPKSESNTNEDNVWYFDNGVSNHMTDSCGDLLIKVPRSANRIYKTQLKVSKEDTNEVGKEHGMFTVLLDERLNEGTRLEAAGNEQPLTGYDGNPFHGYNNPRAIVHSPRDTANNPRVTVHATVTDEQEPDIDFDDLFAPIAQRETIRPFIALAAGKRWKIHQLGYENGFSKW